MSYVFVDGDEESEGRTVEPQAAARIDCDGHLGERGGGRLRKRLRGGMMTVLTLEDSGTGTFRRSLTRSPGSVQVQPELRPSWPPRALSRDCRIHAPCVPLACVCTSLMSDAQVFLSNTLLNYPIYRRCDSRNPDRYSRGTVCAMLNLSNPQTSISESYSIAVLNSRRRRNHFEIIRSCTTWHSVGWSTSSEHLVSSR